MAKAKTDTAIMFRMLWIVWIHMISNVIQQRWCLNLFKQTQFGQYLLRDSDSSRNSPNPQITAVLSAISLTWIAFNEHLLLKLILK